VYLRNLLAKHYLDVGLYYMRRGAYVAAANRAKEIIDTYEHTTSVPGALVLLARAYKVLEMNDLYNDTLRVLKLNYPGYPGIRQLQEIRVN
jgi:outer membrane protein assembly factor BamD